MNLGELEMNKHLRYSVGVAVEAERLAGRYVERQKKF